MNLNVLNLFFFFFFFFFFPGERCACSHVSWPFQFPKSNSQLYNSFLIKNYFIPVRWSLDVAIAMICFKAFVDLLFMLPDAIIGND